MVERMYPVPASPAARAAATSVKPSGCDDSSACCEKQCPISTKKYAQLRDDYNRVMTKATEYTRTLQITQDSTAGAAETVADLLAGLQSDFAKQLDS